MNAPRFSFGSSAKRFSAWVMVKVTVFPMALLVVPPLLAAPAPVAELELLVEELPADCGGTVSVPAERPMANCPVPAPIALLPGAPSRFTPNCTSFSRSSSANLTRSRICFSIAGGRAAAGC